MNDTVAVLLEAVALKALDRTGWVRRGVTRPESVAAHSWGVAWLVLVLLPDDLDRERALTYAVLHDLAEVRVGDLTPHDGVSATDKAAREHTAFSALCEPLSRGRTLRAQWEAYEGQADPEARFVRQLDRLDMALQAVHYADAGTGGLSEFLDSAATVIQEPSLRSLLDVLRSRLAQSPTAATHNADTSV